MGIANVAKKRYQIIAHVFDKRGRCLSVGMNSYTKTHPIQAHFAALVGEPEKQYLHAEIAALLKCKEQVPHTIKIYRYDENGFPMLAKPCKICQAATKAFGIVNVYYSSPNTQLSLLSD